MMFVRAIEQSLLEQSPRRTPCDYRNMHRDLSSTYIKYLELIARITKPVSRARIRPVLP